MSQPSGVKKLSVIELAKSVAALSGLADTHKEFNSLKDSFVPNEHLSRVNQILNGLGQEDEFAIFCKIMGTCESIAHIDQSPIIKNDEKIADFLVSFAPGVSVKGLSAEKMKLTYSCFIEIKSCAKKSFTITSKDLNARRKYANRFGLPLVIAVRFTMFSGRNFWILIEANTLEKRGRKIGCEDLINSLGPVLFDDYGLYTHPSLYIVHYYDSTPGLKGVKHNQYGVHVKLLVLLPDHEPIYIPDDLALYTSILFESFEHKDEKAETEGNVTVSIMHIGGQMRLLSDIVYSSNYLARDADGNMAYDARRTISRLDSEKTSALITRSIIESIVNILNSHKPMLFKMGIGEPDNQEKMLRKLCKK